MGVMYLSGSMAPFTFDKDIYIAIYSHIVKKIRSEWRNYVHENNRNGELSSKE